ncbi:reverse transcriptase domain-containing protein [Tanacetum coccineum]
MNCPVVVEAMIEGFRVRRIHVDGGSSSEVMYEHCFRSLSYRTRSRLRKSRIPLVGFSGEVSYPIGVIDLEVTMGECGKTRAVIMEFAVVKSPSPYNALLGRTGMRSLGVVASTIHSMMKFPTSNGIATIFTTRERLQDTSVVEAKLSSRGSTSVASMYKTLSCMSGLSSRVSVRLAGSCILRGLATPD